jgi:HptB-dependent secretion and biofilm anti anti-sigma factor
MEYTSELLGNTLRINLNGKLTFSDNNAFQSITDISGGKTDQHIEIHLEGLDYIDSSGIGMLLVLKEKCDENGATMTLSRPQGQVAKILRVACIDSIIPVVP